jgi:Secretion system C-terminal sorting domain
MNKNWWFISFAFSIGFTVNLNAQQLFGNQFYEGSPNYRITFDADTTLSKRLKEFDIVFPRVIKSNANICDSNGQFVLGTTAIEFYNKWGDTVPGGSWINNDTFILYDWLYAYPNNSIILPKGNNQYYVFTCTMSDSKANKYFHLGTVDTMDFDQIIYSIVDMNANNGKGKVLNKKILLHVNEYPWLSLSNFTVTRHANGKDWWLIKPSSRQHQIRYKFLVTDDSIYSFQDKEDIRWFNIWLGDNVGQSCFSADGSLYAECNKYSPHSIYSFDRCSGQFTFKRLINIAPFTKWGIDRFDAVCFSPNNKYLYTSDQYFIYQINLDEPNDSLAVQCVSVQDTIAFPGYNTMQLTPTGQIQMGSWGGISGYQNAIMYPNEYGLACGFKNDYLVSGWQYSGTRLAPFNDPPNMPFFALGALKGSPCDTIKPVQSPFKDWLVFPNPTTNDFNIKIPIANAKSAMITIYNVLGQKIQELSVAIDNTYIVNTNINAVANGIYYLKVIVDGHHFYGTKILKK